MAILQNSGNLVAGFKMNPCFSNKIMVKPTDLECLISDHKNLYHRPCLVFTTDESQFHIFENAIKVKMAGRHSWLYWSWIIFDIYAPINSHYISQCQNMLSLIKLKEKIESDHHPTLPHLTGLELLNKKAMFKNPNFYNLIKTFIQYHL